MFVAEVDLDELASACRFADGHLDLAVSGGADSTAMLVLASRLSKDITVWHVDHQLRDDSAVDAKRVEELAARFGAQFELRTVTVEAGPNLEARARAARFDALPNNVATAHTADDLFETFLINLLRGSALDGWIALGEGPHHPILSLRRAQTHAVCEQLNIVPSFDSTNDDYRFVRNALRANVVPELEAIAKRDVVALFARQAALIRDEVAYLDNVAATFDPVDTKVLRDAPVAIARRVIRNWLREVNGLPPDADAIERVLEVVRGNSKATEVTGIGRVSRTANRLQIDY